MSESERYEIEIRERERESEVWVEAVDLVREWLGEDWREIEAVDVDVDLDSMKSEREIPCETWSRWDMRLRLRVIEISNQIFYL